MSTILIITGSARPNSVNHVVVREVAKQLEQMPDAVVTIADLAELTLPYFDSPTVPAKIDSEATAQSVKDWSSLVQASDGVVFVAPEYNHSMSAIQKNAIDWLYNEWRDKPTAFVGYGAYAAKHVFESFKIVSGVVKLRVLAPMAGIMLGEVVDYDGTILDQAALDALLEPTLSELVAVVNSCA